MKIVDILRVYASYYVIKYLYKIIKQQFSKKPRQLLGQLAKRLAKKIDIIGINF